jgi:trimeric autotransporter adhesin
LSLSFASQPIGSSSLPQSIVIANNSGVALNVAGITISNNSKTSGAIFSQANSCMPAIKPQSACSISVSFTPGATGSQGATLEINAGSHAQKVPLNGTGTLAATVSPAKLAFGDQRVETTSASKMVRVTNDLGAPLLFDNFFVAGDFAIIGNGCSSGAAAHSSCAIEVAFKPTVTGARVGTLTISDTASSVPLTVTLTGTGR